MATLIKRSASPVILSGVTARKRVSVPVSRAEVFAAAKVIRNAAALPDREPGENSATETIKRYQDRVKNPKTAIRAKCVECSGGSLKEVAECRVIHCALFPFRMGQNPFHKKTRERLEGSTDVTNEDDDDDDESDNG